MAKSDTYIEAVGRRKTAIARVRMTPSTKRSVVVNGKELAVYFPTKALQQNVIAPLTDSPAATYSLSIMVRGGGVSAQSEAVRHGVARAMVKMDAQLRSPLKKQGFLKRDPRAKERRKFGLKKARKSAQWSKR